MPSSDYVVVPELSALCAMAALEPRTRASVEIPPSAYRFENIVI
jgi:hypothetical protein